MCFGGGGGPTQEEEQAAAEDRIEAEAAERKEIERRAKQKRKDISDALSASVADAGARGVSSRRSLFKAVQKTGSAGGASGYESRFG
tara:strand:+ start:959 stop:1219 length:261 start_codon:yes stop_codon:yes gene_type:complete